MMKSEKYTSSQTSLFNIVEWERSLSVKGADVFNSGSSRVRQEWLSGCREEPSFQFNSKLGLNIGKTAQYERRTLGGVRGQQS